MEDADSVGLGYNIGDWSVLWAWNAGKYVLRVGPRADPRNLGESRFRVVEGSTVGEVLVRLTLETGFLLDFPRSSCDILLQSLLRDGGRVRPGGAA
jgi:hypothetical protein